LPIVAIGCRFTPMPRPRYDATALKKTTYRYFCLGQNLLDVTQP